MIRIVLLALVTGSALGITVGSYFGNFNVEGVILGLVSIICLAAITSFILLHGKRRIAHNEI